MRIEKKVRVVVLTLAVAIAGVALVGYAGKAPDDAKFVGASKCRLCHLKEFKTWQSSPHAKTFDTLLADERKNADCVGCHVTGFGKPSGFTSEEQTAALKDVGCESCHGAGSAHIEAAQKKPESGAWDTKIDKNPGAACLSCHNPHINRKENAEKLRKEKAAK